MSINKITVIINDKNKFYVEGLKCCLTEYFAIRNIQVNFTHCIFTRHARLAFLATEALSVANTHNLNYRLNSGSLAVFILRDRQSDTELPVRRSQLLTRFPTLYRNQSIDKVLESVEQQMVLAAEESSPAPLSLAGSLHKLTKREIEILRFLARGVSNGSIARFLNISEKTVSAHKRNIMTKLNMVRPAELSYWLIQEGWCDAWRFSAPKSVR